MDTVECLVEGNAAILIEDIKKVSIPPRSLAKKGLAAFYHEKAPMFTLSQATAGYCTPTHPPSTSLIQFSVCIFQAHVVSQAAAF